MVSPSLIRKSEGAQSVDINENTKKLFQVIYSEGGKKEERDDDVPKIKVSSLISRLAFFYEKVRNAVDYEEEHLLRKNAIARILHRQIVIEGVIKEVEADKLAEHLLIELIRASYLPNNRVPESKIQETTWLLEKYIRLKDALTSSINRSLNLKADINQAKDLIQEKNRLIRWLINLAACEIEENLSPNPVRRTVVASMFNVLSHIIELPPDLPYKQDLEIQIYLSIGRKYLKLDADMLNFVLFKYYNSEWLDIDKKGSFSAEDDKKIKEIAKGIGNLRALIAQQFSHPLAKQLDKVTRLYSLYFSILSDTISQDPTKIYGELQKGEKGFLAAVRNVCAQKYKKAKSRLWTAAFRSIIYIFLTKSIFAVAIEIPAIHWLNEPLNAVNLAINISFPAILLFFIVLTTRTPGTENTNLIIKGIKEIAFVGEEKKQPILLRRPARRNILKHAVFNLIYAASFCVSIYFIVWFLDLIHFTWVSVTIFLFFLAFVSFFSVIVTRGVKELMVVERKENLFTFLLDLFYMPIILIGRWLSNNVSKINIFIFIFDFIIEAPFKILVEIADDWTKYVRERRDRMEG